MTACDDGDETGYRGKDSLGGEYIGLYEANSSPAPLSMQLTLLRVVSCRGYRTGFYLQWAQHGLRKPLRRKYFVIIGYLLKKANGNKSYREGEGFINGV